MDLCAELYRKSSASAFGIALEEFRETLERIADGSGEKDRTKVLGSLKLEDLALAQGCARGNHAAWERFAAVYGARLHTLALAITREESSAHELAGSIYADLFGSRKLISYSGRGSLEGWLRAVLAQEHVNRMRASRRLVSYESEVESGAQFASEPGKETDSLGGRMEAFLAESVDVALSTLKPDERFLLTAYYLDGRTLADIAGALAVHESTVSRRMKKRVAMLRKQTIKELRRRGVSGRVAEEMLGTDVRDVDVNVGRRLIEAPPFRSGARK